MTKKGFSIIEILIALSIMSIVSLYMLQSTIKYTSNYKVNKKDTLQKIYIDEGFDFIRYELEREKSCKVIGNCIRVERMDGKGYDWIRKDKGGDIIICYGGKYSPTTNNICKDIKEFYVKEQEEIIYVKIIGKKGDEYNRCLIKRE